MRSLHITIDGDIAYCVPDSAIDNVVNHYTSEYTGAVEAGVYLGNYDNQKYNKLMVKHKGISLFVYVERYFFVVIGKEFLNQAVVELFDQENYSPLTLQEFAAFIGENPVLF